MVFFALRFPSQRETRPVPGGVLLTCHGKDSHHAANASVSQQDHLHSGGCALLLLSFGLARGPDAGPEDQSVEKHDSYDAWNVHSHDEPLSWE